MLHVKGPRGLLDFICALCMGSRLVRDDVGFRTISHNFDSNVRIYGLTTSSRCRPPKIPEVGIFRVFPITKSFVFDVAAIKNGGHVFAFAFTYRCGHCCCPANRFSIYSHVISWFHI